MDSLFTGYDTTDGFSVESEDTQVNNDLYGTGYHSNETVSKRRGPLKIRKLTTNARKKDILQHISVSTLPKAFQNVFPFSEFNRMQSAAFPFLFEHDENCVISSPTGSGKTVLFELAVLNLIKKCNFDIGNSKVIYMAPTKSLCSEMFKNWKCKFSNLSVGILTSDTSLMETEKVKKSNIIITTPEKWDLLTRKWTDYSRLFELVRLILVDEVHTLRENRGATLEVVITRMNTMCKDIRIIAVSATIPNISDVATWLKSHRNEHYEMAKVLEYDDSYRQVSLKRHVCTYNFTGSNDFQRDAMYNSKLEELIQLYCQNKPVLIFCPTRASTISTAKYLVRNRRRVPLSGQKQLADRVLFECFQHGIAFHNAGLSMEDRTAVETAFIEGTINILCSTSTLAVGINLPAYLVIIKGTRIWNSTDVDEYTSLDILQMIGRAGRPQFEKEGCAVIMTEPKMKNMYERLIYGTDNLESTLHLNLCEHLTAEISLNTVTDVDSAITWLKNTFFYVRLLKSPANYHEISKRLKGCGSMEDRLYEFCQMLFEELSRNQLISENDKSFSCTPYGNAMARHYILFETIKRYINAKNYLSLQEILTLLSNSNEFSEIKMRHNEKRLFKEINMCPLLRFPFVTEKKQSQILDKTSQKVSLIIQYELGGLEFPSYEGAHKLHQMLVQDKMRVFRHCFRLLKSMIDVFIEKRDGMSLKNTLFLLRSINGNCWENTPMVLRQLKNIGLVSVRKLVRHNVNSLADMAELSENQIEYYLGLKIGSGLKIKSDLSLIPTLKFRSKLEKYEVHGRAIDVYFKVEVSASSRTSVWHGHNLSVDIEASKVSGELIDFRRINLSNLKTPRSFRLNAKIESRLDDIEFSIGCQEIAGVGRTATFSTNDLPKEALEKLTEDSNKNQKRLFMLDSIEDIDLENKGMSSSSDDSLFQYLANRDPPPNRVEQDKNSHLYSRTIRTNGNFECYHTCKDKNKCRHLCCKEGIPKECLKHKERRVESGPINTNFTPNDRMLDTNFAPALNLNEVDDLSSLEEFSISRTSSQLPDEIQELSSQPENTYTYLQDNSSKRVDSKEPILRTSPEYERQFSEAVIVPIDINESSSTEPTSSGSADGAELDFLGSDVSLG
ncbi:hypothetical protein NCAS_0E00200 [Naumovozyma castellii]|uniref:DNA 3'-5' helicase n=1 Tax=Naumovozyma castellii TaxID=27288 RepID=G0VF25_NAUCA|nr:hypothetical protein NCAS_0E00200 [Naumovozyma castellii CBS 4309]CCC70090.1 hypothetical protein NCAS_0E00200 [Naumovozyma castellii CBS 4309]